MLVLGHMLQLPLRVLLHHRLLGLDALLSRRRVLSLTDDEGYISPTFIASFGIRCRLDVLLCIGIYICVLSVSISICLVHFAYFHASCYDDLLLLLLY